MIETLPWLLPCPTDLPGEIRSLKKAPCPGGNEWAARLKDWAAYALTFHDMGPVNRLLDHLQKTGVRLEGLEGIRIGIISNTTTDLILPAIRVTGLRYGFLPELVSTPFDQAWQTVRNPESDVYQTPCHVVLLAMDPRRLPFWPEPGSDGSINRSFDHVRQMCEAVSGTTDSTLIVQTIPQLPHSLFGSYDAVSPSAPNHQIGRFNRRLAAWAESNGALVFDVARLGASVGLSRWHDLRHWHLSKTPLAMDMIPLYADHLWRLVAASRGLSRRCLVLDLDNTIWGGVIGDDGVDGIVIGPGDPVGEAYLAVQSMALDLVRRGIVLAVSSKNDPDNARLPFQNHPDMLLKETDITVFEASWDDKASQIERIAAALGWTVDKLVLLDDNPAERKQVRDALPSVAVPELPDDPALFPVTLLSAGYFEAVAFSGEDRRRTELYRGNRLRSELKSKTRNLDSYLTSLDMVLTVSPFVSVDFQRITQLINRSNQFNLTGHRYTQHQIASLSDDSRMRTFQFRLSDIFGDNGLISIVICRSHDSRWWIDSWLMSCRVLGRKVEQAVLNILAEKAAHEGVEGLVGRYVPSSRNSLVANHFEAMGFSPMERAGSQESLWCLGVDDYQPLEAPVRIRYAGES